MTPIRYAFLMLGTIGIFGTPAHADGKFQVFFVSVGSTYYLQPSGAGLHGFGELSGANASARLVAELLSKHGAVAGVTITSRSDRFVSKSDFETGVQAVAQQLKAHHPQNPFLVIYFAGHGISEGIAWNHFSVPGNFVYGAPLEHLDIQQLANHTIHAGLLADELDALKVPYLLLLDTCYEGKPQSFQSPVLSSQAIQNLNDVAGILRFQNEFHTPNPVIFSAEAGKEVPLAADPRDPVHDSLGPIARRLLLLDRKITSAGTELSLTALVAQLTSGQLDTDTTRPITHATAPTRDDVVLARPAGGVTEVLAVPATATFSDTCCSSAHDTAPGTSGRRMMGTLTFEGPAREFVSGGRHVSVSRPGTSVTLIERDPQSIELTFDGSDGWELDLAAPSARPLSAKSYRAAQRYPMQEDSRPGLSLSGTGRACNEISGEFTVTRLVRDGTKQLTELIVEFVQRCDDEVQSLHGTAHVYAR